MSSRVEMIRKRVAIGAAALLALAFGAVETWGRQPRQTAGGASSVLEQEQQLAQGTDRYRALDDGQPDAPAPLTTRQS